MKLNVLVVTVLLVCLQLSQAYTRHKECTIEHSSKDMWELKLDDKIMCNYSSYIPPKPYNNSSPIDITPRFLVKSFKLSSEDQVFSIHSMTFLSWVDDRLKWDPKDYNGIDETMKNGFRFWLPGIKLYNSISDVYDQSYDFYMLCRITSVGMMTCLSFVTFEATCVIDLSHWPFDTQVCSLEFGPWMNTGTKLRILEMYHTVSFIGSRYGAEWDIMDVKVESNSSSEIQLKMFFTLMRHSDGIAAIVIYPMILLSVLNFFTLFFDVRRECRMCILCFSLLCHFFFLSELGMDIPQHSKRPPTILLFYRGSVVMNIISIMLTFVMKNLCMIKTKVPKVIAIVTKNVLKTQRKLFIYLHLSTSDNDVGDQKEPAEAWSDFVSILNCTWICFNLIVYIVMCFVYIPLRKHMKQNIFTMDYAFK